MATQVLLTAEIKKALPPLYANEDKPIEEHVVIVKLFHPYGAGTWWITEYDPETNTAFGAVDLGMTHGEPEWGYIDMNELTALRATLFGRTMPFQAIERDASFTPTTWGALRAKAAPRAASGRA